MRVRALRFSKQGVSAISARLHYDTLVEARALSRARVPRCGTSTGFLLLAPPSLRLDGIYYQPLPLRQLSLREWRKGMVSVLWTHLPPSSVTIAKELRIPCGESGFRRPPPRGLRGLQHDIRVALPTLCRLPTAVAMLHLCYRASPPPACACTSGGCGSGGYLPLRQPLPLRRPSRPRGGRTPATSAMAPPRVAAAPPPPPPCPPRWLCPAPPPAPPPIPLQ